MIEEMVANEEAANEDLSQTASAGIQLSPKTERKLVELTASSGSSPEELLSTMVEEHAKAIERTLFWLEEVEREEHLSDADEVDVELAVGGTELIVLVSLPSGLWSHRLVPDAIKERIALIATQVASEIGGDFNEIRVVLQVDQTCVSEFYVPEAKESQRAL